MTSSKVGAMYSLGRRILPLHPPWRRGSKPPSASKAERGYLLERRMSNVSVGVHPAVVQALGGPSLFGLAMSGWEATFDLGLFPFVTDERRAVHVEQVRQFAETIEAEVAHLHLFGDTGVGKSRQHSRRSIRTGYENA
jgi:hypothetical protein